MKKIKPEDEEYEEEGLKGKKKTKSKEETKNKEVTKKKKKVDIEAAIKKLQKRKKKKRASESGKYFSLRNLMEMLFAEDPNIDDLAILRRVAAEYPESKMAQGSYHQAWYRTHIVSKKEFKTIELPEWAK